MRRLFGNMIFSYGYDQSLANNFLLGYLCFAIEWQFTKSNFNDISRF